MKLFDTVDGLLAGTRYLAWAIAVLGVLGSAVLFIVNLSLGFSAAAVFLAAGFLAIGVTLLLFPKQIAAGRFAEGRTFFLGGISCLAALVIMGVVWISCGGFPAVNLLFI